jgi:hypothetical protein
MRVLPTFNGYTIDYRLKGFRRAVPGEELAFTPFQSEEGRKLMKEAWQDPTLVIRGDGAAGEDWVCVCGNRATDWSFFPCDWSGRQAELSAESWASGLWYGLWCCIQCGRIIDADTLAVVSLTAESQEPAGV